MVEPFRILCAEPQNYSERGLAQVARLAQLDSEVLSQAEFALRAPEYDGLMVRLKLRVTDEIIGTSPRLRVIMSPTTGLDHIALEAACARKIEVLSLAGETEHLRTVSSTAEHTWALLLSLVRRIPWAFQAVRRNEWNQDRFRGHELSGKTLGIIGYGRLGKMVGQYGLGFQMRVLAYDPYIEITAEGVGRVETLDALLGASDVLSVHVPLQKSTIGLIGPREIGLLPRGAVLINTSRGMIVDEGALLAALKSGHLAGAAVDVLTDEPGIPEGRHPMVAYARDHDNLLITPHIGGASAEAIESTDLFVIGKFERWLGGREGRSGNV